MSVRLSVSVFNLKNIPTEIGGAWYEQATLKISSKFHFEPPWSNETYITWISN